MTYYLVVGGEDWTPVASITGWKDFRKWATRRTGSELRHLLQYGWSQDPGSLEEQLAEAVEQNDPSKDVASVAEACLEAIRNRGASASSVLLTDGLTSVDDPDDSGWELDDEKSFEKGDLPGHPFRGNQWSGGGAESSSMSDTTLDRLQGQGLSRDQAGWAAKMVGKLESIFSGPGRAASINEVLTAAKYPEYLRGIMTESPGVEEIEAVVAWSVRRGRMWEGEAA